MKSCSARFSSSHSGHSTSARLASPNVNELDEPEQERLDGDLAQHREAERHRLAVRCARRGCRPPCARASGRWCGPSSAARRAARRSAIAIAERNIPTMQRHDAGLVGREEADGEHRAEQRPGSASAPMPMMMPSISAAPTRDHQPASAERAAAAPGRPACRTRRAAAATSSRPRSRRAAADGGAANPGSPDSCRGASGPGASGSPEVMPGSRGWSLMARTLSPALDEVRRRAPRARRGPARP